MRFDGGKHHPHSTRCHNFVANEEASLRAHAEPMAVCRVNDTAYSSLEYLGTFQINRANVFNCFTGLSFRLVGLLLLAHWLMPNARQHTSKFFFLSHYNPNTGEYAVGSDDFYFLAFYVVFFTGLRASCIEYILAPLGRRWGIRKRKNIVRFTEQAWLLCYYSVFYTLGVVRLELSFYSDSPIL